MRTFNENDRVIVIREGDRNNNKHGIIESIMELRDFVTIYNIVFDDGAKGYYFFSNIIHE